MPETIRATVEVDGAPLSSSVEPNLRRVVVDTHLHLPSMFELTFYDESGCTVGDAGISVGTEITIFGGAADSHSADGLITGEVTSIEGDYDALAYHTIVRGYEKSHRLQRARRTRTFVDMKDADIARKIAKDAKLKIGKVDTTPVTHKHLSQVAQTDWEFLKGRATELGFEVGVAAGEFFFRKASGSTGGGALGAVASALGAGTKLTFKDNLLWFKPRLTGAGLVPEVEVRVWDPKGAKVVVGKAKVKTGSAKLDSDPGDLADTFGTGLLGARPPSGGASRLGPAPSTKARITVNRPVAWGPTASRAADAVAAGLAEHVGSTFAEAEGYARGDPGIDAGKSVTIDNVPLEFKGSWIVTNATHIFDDDEGGYFTRFVVSGRQDRSLLGLTSMGGTQGETPAIHGMVSGIVTNNNDPDKLGRVKLAFPWLDPSYESDWARVAQFGAGASWGALFLPEVNDEVLIGFEFGDMRRPYVVGGLVNGKSKIDLGGQAVKQKGAQAEIVKRGFVSKEGHRLVFDDDPTSKTSGIQLGTKDSKLIIRIDKANGAISIICNSSPPGKINIEAPANGSQINVKCGGNVAIEAGPSGSLQLKGGAAGVKIQSSGPVEVKGNPIKLN